MPRRSSKERDFAVNAFRVVEKAIREHMDARPNAVVLYFAYYNFCRVHQTLRVTPAMETGLSDHVWRVEELVSLMPEPEAKKRALYNKLSKPE